MINVKITTKNVTEDFIAVERETGAVALPSKHVFGVFVAVCLEFVPGNAVFLKRNVEES